MTKAVSKRAIVSIKALVLWCEQGHYSLIFCVAWLYFTPTPPIQFGLSTILWPNRTCSKKDPTSPARSGSIKFKPSASYRGYETNEKYFLYKLQSVQLDVGNYNPTEHLTHVIFCCNAALRTTRGSPSVRPSLLAFLPFSQKIFRQPKLRNLWSYTIFFCGCPYEKKKSKILCTRGYSTFWTPSTK